MLSLSIVWDTCIRENHHRNYQNIRNLVILEILDNTKVLNWKKVPEITYFKLSNTTVRERRFQYGQPSVIRDRREFSLKIISLSIVWETCNRDLYMIVWQQAVCALWLRWIMVVKWKISYLHPVVVEWTRRVSGSSKIAWINVEFNGNSLSVAVPSKVKKCLRDCATLVIPPWQIRC